MYPVLSDPAIKGLKHFCSVLCAGPAMQYYISLCSVTVMKYMRQCLQGKEVYLVISLEAENLKTENVTWSRLSQRPSWLHHIMAYSIKVGGIERQEARTMESAYFMTLLWASPLRAPIAFHNHHSGIKLLTPQTGQVPTSNH